MIQKVIPKKYRKIVQEDDETRRLVQRMRTSQDRVKVRQRIAILSGTPASKIRLHKIPVEQVYHRSLHLMDKGFDPVIEWLDNDTRKTLRQLNSEFRTRIAQDSTKRLLYKIIVSVCHFFDLVSERPASFMALKGFSFILVRDTHHRTEYRVYVLNNRLHLLIHEYSPDVPERTFSFSLNRAGLIRLMDRLVPLVRQSRLGKITPTWMTRPPTDHDKQILDKFDVPHHLP